MMSQADFEAEIMPVIAALEQRRERLITTLLKKHRELDEVTANIAAMKEVLHIHAEQLAGK